MGFTYADYEESGTEIFGIKFARLNVPFKRRWQTFCISVRHLMFLGLCQYLFLFFYLYVYVLFHPHLKYLAFCYICWYIYDWKTLEGGYSFQILRKLLPASRDYFPAKLVKTVDLDVGTNYVFGVYPHGMFCFGILTNFLTGDSFEKAFPEFECTFIVLSTVFKLPIIREMLLLTGTSPSTKENILYHLSSPKKNKITIIAIGGVAEMLISEPGTNKVIINNRKGFVRLALETGSPLVPVYTFGENEVLPQYQSERIYKFQNFLRKFALLMPPLLKGRGFFQYTFGILPHRRPLTTVVGKPVPVPKIKNASEQIVDEYHLKFKKELIELFETNKHLYDPKGKEAELICL